jgi:hypothetical protein
MISYPLSLSVHAPNKMEYQTLQLSIIIIISEDTIMHVLNTTKHKVLAAITL